MTMALDGVKVLELASMWAAPTAGMYLADQGAEVIKIEAPTGDECRRFGQRKEYGNESPSFLVVNRNKRGMVVDIRTPRGREVVCKLVGQSDVLIHNYRAGATERLGLRYEDLEPLNPGLIYCHVSPYGKQGPMANQAGYDLVCQGLTGQMERRNSDGTPIGPGMFATDAAAGLTLAYGVALALLARHRTGKGQRVETSLLHTALAVQLVSMVRLEMDGNQETRPSEDRAPARPYRCADGQWVLPVPVGDKQFATMYRTIAPELAEDPRFATTLGRTEHADELIGRLAALFATRNRDEWVRVLEAHDVPVTPVLAKREVFDHQQITANGMFTDMRHPALGRHEMIQPPVYLSSMPGQIRATSPLQGQHTVEVLRELGYAETDIQAMLEAGEIIQA